MSKISTRIFYKKNCITLRLDKPYKILDQKKKKEERNSIYMFYNWKYEKALLNSATLVIFY